MNEFTVALNEKMKAVIKLIYETDALQSWTYEDGDGEPSIADLLRESYKMLEAEEALKTALQASPGFDRESFIILLWVSRCELKAKLDAATQQIALLGAINDVEIAPLKKRVEKAESLLSDIASVFYTDMLHQGEWEAAIHELLRENGYRGPGG